MENYIFFNLFDELIDQKIFINPIKNILTGPTKNYRPLIAIEQLIQTSTYK